MSSLLLAVDGGNAKTDLALVEVYRQEARQGPPAPRTPELVREDITNWAILWCHRRWVAENDDDPARRAKFRAEQRQIGDELYRFYLEYERLTAEAAVEIDRALGDVLVPDPQEES